MPFLGVKISEELETLIDEEVKRSDKSKSDIVRDALNQYFNVAIPEGTGLIVLDKKELINLIDSRLGVKPEVKREVKLIPEVKPKIKQDVKPVKQDVKPEVKPTIQRLSEDSATQEKIKELWRSGERNRQAIAQQVGYKNRTVQQYIKDCLESGELEK
ncbi:MAG: ribbon-helix-helix domain-containing protein [Methanothrix sp.]|jgi:DNA-binding NarL/FixJ family response regulator|nr:ribbon-helix-helix domain-containing protein [Methanothrix sp.]